MVTSAPRGPRGGVTLASLLLLYLALAFAYQRAVPLFEAPDEPGHIHYVAFLHREGRPPRMIGSTEVPGEGMQPPLYYALLQPLFAWISPYDPMLEQDLDRANRWIYESADLRQVPPGTRIRMLETTHWRGRIFQVDPALGYLLALRWGSLVFGALAVLLTFDAARRVSSSVPFAVLCTALLAFSPQFLFVSSYVSNDVASTALGAAAFWLFAVAVERGRVTRIDYLAAAALLPIGFATKLSSLPTLLVCCAALFALDRRPLRERLGNAGLAVALGLLLALPSLSMNRFRFGGALGVSAMLESANSPDGLASYGGVVRYLVEVYPYLTFRSYWASFGWMHVIGPHWLYLAFFTLCWTGLLGLLLAWRDERRALERDPGARDERRARALRRFALATALATVAAHLWLNMRIPANQGRHLFGAAPHFASLLALGIAGLDGRRAFGVGWRTAGAVCAVLLALALFCLTRVLLTVYR